MRFFTVLFSLSALFFYSSPITPVTTSVVFDLGGVLFKTSFSEALQEIGILNLAGWACHDAASWNISTELRNTYFKFLHKVTPYDPHCPPARDASGLLLPQCMCDWMLGKVSGHDMLEKIDAIINAHPEYFASKREERIIRILCGITFLPEKMVKTRTPIKEMWQLLRKCKEKGYKVYILSNRDTHSIEYMLHAFPFFEECIDGIVTSSEAGTLKPDPAIFHYLCEKFNISPENSVFFDDRIENIVAAQSIRMNTVWCRKGKKFKHIVEDFQRHFH